MNNSIYLIIHRDHVFDPQGINGGAETATLSLCKFLTKAGKQVILAGQFSSNITQDLADGVEYWNLGPEFDVKSVLERVSSLGVYHLISAGRALPLMLSLDETACLSRSLISHDRSSNDTGLNAKVLSRIADNIFCVSQAQKEFFLRDGVDEQKLIVIHNGVDLDLFKEAPFDQRDPAKLVFVGALVVDKGLHILLESYAKLKQKHRDLSLDVYGSAELWDRDAYLNTAELESKLPGLKFHGKVPQTVIALALQTAGICVIPSIWFDPFPLVSIDAQACGCPVVAFDVGGLGESIRDGETGLLVKDISQDSLSAALDSLLSSPGKLSQFSSNALNLSRPRFTWEKLVETVVAKCEAAAFGRSKAKIPKVALFSTWNQECGLATYAKYLFTCFNQEDFWVLAEDVGSKVEASDEANVIRCWSASDTDFYKLESIIKDKEIEILFFNFHTHYRLFSQTDFIDFIVRVQNSGVKIAVHLHNTFTLDPKLRNLLSHADQVIVLSAENRLEAVANGASPEKVCILPHGVEVSSNQDERQSLRQKFGIAEKAKMICSFGFVQTHKGMEGVIQAVAHLKSKNIEAVGYILGNANKSDASSIKYLEELKQYARDLNISDSIMFSDRYLPSAEVLQYLKASDLVLMNYRSQHYEASGACAVAIGAGSLVAASTAPAFMSFKDAVWHITPGFNAALSAELLLTDQRLAEEIRKNAASYARKYSWQNVAKILSVHLINIKAVKNMHKEIDKVENAKYGSSRKGNNEIRILMQNRNSTFTHRGGDTILMEKTIAGLKKKGVQVTVDLEGKEDPRNYDLVHLFNFVLPDLVKHLAQKAHRAGVPYVVTTLYEDIASFHNPSILQAKHLIEYVRNGQNRAWYENSRIDYAQVEKCKNFDNTWTVRHASALIANGEQEAQTLGKDYPFATNIKIVPVGHDLGREGNAEDFYKEYGIKDFVLCVGRLESRKNQLMLLRAMEDSDIPVVLAAGEFSYQPEYQAAVQQFKRKGKTLILGQLSPQMLANAYCAARVHVLPSWYELPGLVSLEAAYYGCNIVVTDCGTARSYFEDKAFYCEPISETSILEAVLAAYYSPKSAELKELSMKYTWDNAADSTLQVYKDTLGIQEAGVELQVDSVRVYDLDTESTRFQEILEQGEMAAKERDLIKANALLQEAEKLNPNSVRMLRARGAVLLAEGKIDEARSYFERGISLDPNNSRLYSGLGMCEMQSKAPEKAHANFVKALALSPHELVAILQLLECAYVLNKYDDLERVLRRYLEDHPQDMQMQYCLAGCLFKQNQLAESESLTDKILEKEPFNLGAKQLKTAILEAKNNRPKNDVQPLAKKITLSQDMVFDSVDQEISEIEELKRVKDYEQVKTLCRVKLQSTELKSAQIEKLTLLYAEAEVLQGDTVSADTKFNQVLAANPESARALCGKGALSASRGDWQAAKNYFERANYIDPVYDVAWAGLALYYYSIRENEKAWELFMRAIDLNPENVRALLGIIELGYSLGRLGEVENVLKLYLEMHPLDLNFLYSLAGCYFAQNKLKEAAAELDKIHMFDAENKNANELRGLINERIGEGASSMNA